MLTAIQVAVLNHIHLSGYVNPYLYILFILILPFETPKWLLLIVAFFQGLVIDLFVQTPGMHAAACVFMAFLRPLIAATISSKKEYEPGIQPSIQDLGFNWFLTYSAILTVAHHTILFMMEVFHFYEFAITIQRILYSSVITLILIILSQYIFYRKPRNIISGKI
ncbi:MAG: hypothetical protein BWY27_00736 [Bacteroidetes bacterium ADurb.Bin234]|nr:MAG: hypothetical protein BWY27_00736 [Bacteroidetes bacterium ADurb.Bin234]